MLEELSRHWGMLAFRGVLAILFGVVAWIWPGITLYALVLLFGAYALVDGIFAVVAAIRGTPGQPGTGSRTWLAVTGILGILLGIITLAWPGVTALILLLLIAWWAVITGIFEIVSAINLRQEIEEWVYVLSGVISVLFGVLLFVWPVSGALSVIWLIGLFSILFGISLLTAAFRLRKIAHSFSAPAPAP
jgi:uncharacterized membrane protein HdeD (DUF308 family)